LLRSLNSMSERVLSDVPVTLPKSLAIQSDMGRDVRGGVDSLDAGSSPVTQTSQYFIAIVGLGLDAFIGAHDRSFLLGSSRCPQQIVPKSAGAICFLIQGWTVHPCWNNICTRLGKVFSNEESCRPHRPLFIRVHQLRGD
jgi:hypothetical protein